MSRKKFAMGEQVEVQTTTSHPQREPATYIEPWGRGWHYVCLFRLRQLDQYGIEITDGSKGTYSTNSTVVPSRRIRRLSPE